MYCFGFRYVSFWFYLKTWLEKFQYIKILSRIFFLFFSFFLRSNTAILKVMLCFSFSLSPVKPARASMLSSNSPVTVRACFTFRLVSLGGVKREKTWEGCDWGGNPRQCETLMCTQIHFTLTRLIQLFLHTPDWEARCWITAGGLPEEWKQQHKISDNHK